MAAPDLKGTRVTVVGLAKSGVAAARLCAREGARVTVTDRRGEAELGGALAALPASVTRHLGGHDPADFTGAELVVASPGVPLANPEIQEARRRGVAVWGEVELAARFLGGLPIVGITGTNGKSTTTALTGALLARDRRTFVGGNLGTPLSELVLSGEPADAAVVELSSFQLEGIERFRARVAAVLNVTPDHLDRYPDVDAYAAAKARLFATQQPDDVAVANARDPRALAMAGASRADLHTFGFGAPTPASARDEGGEPGPEGTAIWFTPRGRAPERYQLRNRALRGRHNRENAMAAVLCARLMGVPGEAVQAGLDAFPGLHHRLELVAEGRGVEWVNDSKATNVDSTFVGLAAFPSGAPRVVLIMGGRGKKAPYAPLRPLFGGRVKALLTIGEDAPAIERELGDLAPTEPCGDLADAVRRAAVLSGPGDVVLLSPACASYDQFANYEERGEAFRRLATEQAR
ncbi:UDP-N-acetylmuramoylalanine/D-glutamate ligase [Anaeromyxobacter dehalogenans 2CP-1]|uniref:UDP-N-acetylmuramoylalanine--D-glutamate ligase n=1 Tax=Anaeromyxobacter dehalogenans (strain ATCC BAA-258 / DSM 21875 / 2CP-1) TaxID=455488 RepID=B8J8E6_ANAD2|nr:UDP-N-acetylmuramoyl-L-alanine--D-glutamate ligase [Anaeromyxobacter dehalogenans]ACL67232.1 UDP-N-acetylmuramoylalanine/D-glutamate ligase [Anaeromyxobacter dehalogenans 2CP-1]